MRKLPIPDDMRKIVSNGKNDTMMKHVSFHITQEQYEYLNFLVEKKIIPSRSEALRFCISFLMFHNEKYMDKYEIE